MALTTDVKAELVEHPQRTADGARRRSDGDPPVRRWAPLHRRPCGRRGRGRRGSARPPRRPRSGRDLRRAARDRAGAVGDRARRCPLRGSRDRRGGDACPPDRPARRSGVAPFRGLPNRLTTGSREEIAGLWRGAFLAAGSLSEPGRSAMLEVSCPTSEAAMAVVGAAHRLGVAAKAREVRGMPRVVVREGEAIRSILAQMGARRPPPRGRRCDSAARCAPV